MASRVRKVLMNKWSQAFPDAASEVSGEHKPLLRLDVQKEGHPAEPDEAWYNDVYYVTVRRYVDDLVFGLPGGGMIQLGISALDGRARHDWRDFQAIKNQIAGPECEAFELYPAESRLLDPSNYYSLWCFPGIGRINVGWMGERDVRDVDSKPTGPQRAFPARAEEPSDER